MSSRVQFHRSPPSATFYNYASIQNNDGRKMQGSKRVITFCLLTTVLPTIFIVLPLYLRNIKYADVMYKISDSDVIQIHKGQSSIFCEKHSLNMNIPFNAFQMTGTPQLSDKRKHIRLKKSMTLPDDTLEYWGFYLFKGASVELKACSRYDGSKILVVRGDKILDTCGILESNKNKKDPPQTQDHVVITFEKPQKNNSTSKPALGDYKSDNEKLLDFDRNYLSEENVSLTTHLNKAAVLNSTSNEAVVKERRKRNTGGVPLHNPNTVLDTGVNHGGNAINSTLHAPEEDVSSFENSLYECYQDNTLMTSFFPCSTLCNSTHYLEKTVTLKVTHDVLTDGYYYYIFYSDNDIVSNDIHVIFDIYKPTFQYVNMSASKVCVNKTECEFDVGFLSDELVIVEVPTKDGLNHLDSDSSILTSVCHPRVSVYIFFPVSVLLLILLFAFL